MGECDAWSLFVVEWLLTMRRCRLIEKGGD
jgi:hypothetical protein